MSLKTVLCGIQLVAESESALYFVAAHGILTPYPSLPAGASAFGIAFAAQLEGELALGLAHACIVLVAGHTV